MVARVQFAEPVEREEREGRSRLHFVESKIRELRAHRQALLDDVRQLVGEQKDLFDHEGPLQKRLEELHRTHRELGHKISQQRPLRESARKSVDDALAAVRMSRNAGPSEDYVRPTLIRREIQQLELKQQTTALPLAEENAIVARLRELGKRLQLAEKSEVALEARDTERKKKEDELRRCRAEVERLTVDGIALRREREAVMAAMREQLVAIGQQMGAIREKAQQRSEVMAKIDVLSRQIRELEREAQRIVQRARARRQETRRAVARYASVNRRAEATIIEATADAQLEELLKSGKVTLGG